ncbi:MobF family relaxase [Herbaspirillum huttiense]|uniref:MobF family relaxase n=1 Tax=Herbaspirillum huttiense TaxID=863372 RepID=UPI002176975E|nr:MobF family relaxase [Herbaspirillum huttiense]UWE19305.1 relaxase domain-containing protein [Herbaspirillum huttiense]
MITIASISSSGDAAKYHDAALVNDGTTPAKEADNYYANDQAVATWQGEAAALLGIQGQKVTKEQFVEFLEGRLVNPNDGELQDLGANSKGNDRRLGYDFTISAPKSVSVVGLVGGDQRVIDAHVEANHRAMAWLEKHGAQIRVKDPSGNNRIEHTNNLLYATVQHETSRQNDPQLHNHNVIVAVTYDTAALKWRSLTNDELYQIRTSADTIYKNELALLLEEAGYTITRDPNGIDFEIDGFSSAQLGEFSQRTQQMNEALQARGGNPEHASYHARQAAVLDSRAAKNDKPKELLWQQWRERARETGLNVDALVEQSLERAEGQLPDLMERRAQAAEAGVARAIEHLGEREQSFKHAELEERGVFFSAGAASVKDVQAAVAERLDDRSLLDRGVVTKSRLLTTATAVSRELTLKDAIEKGHKNGQLVLQTQEQYDIALAKFEARKSAETGTTWRLTAEQRNASYNILMHGDKFQGVQGDAGTGKTAALEFVQEVAKDRGWEVVGMATSTTAARQLEKDSGIKSQTVAAFMLHKDKQAAMLKKDLDKLAIEVAHRADNMPAVKLAQRLDLNLTAGNKSFGQARYVFDEKTGQVHKSPAENKDRLNRLGHRLTDMGEQRAEESRNWATAPTLGEKLRGRAASIRASVERRVGAALATYQIVGKEESKRALEFRDQEGLRNFNQLLKEYSEKHAALMNLRTTGHVEGKKYLLVMDESSMTGTKDTARLVEMANEFGARVVLQGDIKQHGSVAAGRAFEQAQQLGINLSTIEETRRFDNATPQTKRAIVEMKHERYAEAIKGLDTTEVKDVDTFAQVVAARYIANLAELESKGKANPKVGIVAITNDDRKDINNRVQAALRADGRIAAKGMAKEHLDDPKLTEAQSRFAASLADNHVNRMVALRDYKSLRIRAGDILAIRGFDSRNNLVRVELQDGKTVEFSPEKFTKFEYARHEERYYSVGDRVVSRANHGKLSDPQRVINGEQGTVVAIDEEKTTIKWDGEKPRVIAFSNQQIMRVDLAYARTSFKEQGVTTDREIVAVSQTGAYWFNKQAAYVAASRAKDNTEIVTTDKQLMLKNAGKETEKTTALNFKRKDQVQEKNQQQAIAQQLPNQPAPTQDKGRELGISL